MACHAITPAVCRFKVPSLLKLNLDLLLETTWLHSVAVQTRRKRQHTKKKRRWVGVIGSTRNECHDTKCPSARRLAMVRKDTGARIEVSDCLWIVANEAVDSTRACHTMRRSSRRLVCRGRPERGHRVNDVSSVH
ncbi:uncharacterized protein TNCV_95021 [Trichonephila clavipes]|nr:uncharacterized protein TNCV_95021 [Trichonephila clavipes]